MEYAQQSLDLAEKSGDRAGKMISLKFLGTALGRQGKLQREVEFYKKSLVIAKEIKNEIEISNCLNNLGLTADLGGDIVTAERLIEQALEWRTAEDDEGIDHEATYSETEQFVHFVIEQVEAVSG